MRTDIRFRANGLMLASWLYRPSQPGPRPLVGLARGFSASMEMDLDDGAACFVDAGFACLAYNRRPPRFE